MGPIGWQEIILILLVFALLALPVIIALVVALFVWKLKKNKEGKSRD